LFSPALEYFKARVAEDEKRLGNAKKVFDEELSASEDEKKTSIPEHNMEPIDVESARNTSVQ
jgi:hypothetical protein